MKKPMNKIGPVDNVDLRHSYETVRDDALDCVNKEFMKKFLAHYRNLVAQHDTKGHTIQFTCGMGAAAIKVDDKLSHHWNGKLEDSLYKLLQDIQEDAESYDWGYLLDGEKLNLGETMTNLLLVEDDEDVIEAFVMCFDLYGADKYDIKIARNFEEAQKILAAESFEIVVTDFNFPGGNGDQVAELAYQRNIPQIYLHSSIFGQDKSTRYTQRLEKLNRHQLKTLFFS